MASDTHLTFVFPHNALGGSDLAMLETIDLLREKGIGVSAIFPKEGPTGQRLIESGHAVEYVPMDWWVDSKSLVYWG